MNQTKRNLAVLQERISPENVLAMSEMLAMIATKKLMAYMGKLAENAHVNLCRDVFCKGESGYVLTDSYDLVQSTALFLCEHYGAHLDDLYTTKKSGKRVTIKRECYLLMTRILCKKHSTGKRCKNLETTVVAVDFDEPHEAETDYEQADAIVSSLDLTENMTLALEHRMAGMSYPEIGRLLSRATSTVYEYFTKMRARYSTLYGVN